MVFVHAYPCDILRRELAEHNCSFAPQANGEALRIKGDCPGRRYFSRVDGLREQFVGAFFVEQVLVELSGVFVKFREEFFSGHLSQACHPIGFSLAARCLVESFLHLFDGGASIHFRPSGGSPLVIFHIGIVGGALGAVENGLYAPSHQPKRHDRHHIPGWHTEWLAIVTPKGLG